MAQSWRLKAYLVLFTLLLSAYVLVPTFGQFNAVREQAEKNNKPLPFYLKLFPDKELNLGLDLRGGIYLELEVSVQEAVQNRIDLTASSLLRYLKDQQITEGVAIDRIHKTNRIRAMLPNAEAYTALRKHVDENYSRILAEEITASELVYEIQGQDPAAVQSIYSEMIHVLSQESGVADIQRVNDSNLIRVVFASGTNPSSLQSTITQKFPALKEITEPNKIIFQPTDLYINDLKNQSVRQAVETIRNRIDRYGVAEPSIRQMGDTRVAIELPGVTDPDRAIDIIKKAGRLEFKIVDQSLQQEQLQTMVANIRKDLNLPEGYSADTTQKINEALKDKIPSNAEIAFQLEYDSDRKKVVRAIPYLLKHRAEVTGDMLKGAQPNSGDKGPYVSLSFNPMGAQVFAELTGANVGNLLAILLDGNVVSAPVINERIAGGEASISFGERGKGYDVLMKEAEDLGLILQEGALPATLNEVTKTVVGPSLGKSTIQNGIWAALIAGFTVIVFMFLYYKKAGLIADGVLAINVLMILGLLAMFQATLTLPGIAGIVLTMGMALDANIIIFERIREELKSGKNVRLAIEYGFSNAWSAVFDTHLTTFLSGGVLYYFGTGPIRGFAVTLMVGVLTTFFTAYWVSKLVYEYLIYKVKIEKVSI